MAVGLQRFATVAAPRSPPKTPRLATYERPKRDGFVRLFADPKKRILVGAVAVGPQAAEWLSRLQNDSCKRKAV